MTSFLFIHLAFLSRKCTPRHLAALIFALLIPACGSSEKSDPYTANMDDFSYRSRRDRTYGESASGKTIKLDQYAGKFVWVDYAATWWTRIT